MGDVHPLGNPALLAGSGERPPHRQRHRRQVVGDCDPADAAYFQQRYQDFDKRLTAAEKRWDAQMAPYRGRKVVTYHRSLPNFAERFGLDVIDYVEPRPGIPPTPSHTLEVINAMKRENVQADPGRAVLRSEDAQLDWPRDRRAGGR